MSLGNLQVGNAKPITASAVVKTGDGALLGFLIVSSSTATVAIYDGQDATGTNLMPATGSLTVTTPTWVPFPVAFAKGLFIAITGTAQIVPVWA